MGGLLNSTILDVMVGLIFVYILLAIMCSSINEWIAGFLRLRAATLAQGLTELLDCQRGTPPAAAVPAGGAGVPAAAPPAANADAANPAAETWLLNQFKGHPLITAMRRDGAKLPSYIPSRTFATALMDIVTPDNKGPIAFDDLQRGVNALPDGDVKKSLLALIQNAHNDLEKAQSNIEGWYDDTMDQVSGWYKRKAAWVTICVAIFLTLGTDADTIQITQNLWKNPTARAQIVEESKKANNTDGKVPQESKKELDQMSTVLPGWKQLPQQTDSDTGKFVLAWLEKALGWLLTVAAVSLGAPFWFDLLNKLANLRNAGQKPEKSPA